MSKKRSMDLKKKNRKKKSSKSSVWNSRRMKFFITFAMFCFVILGSTYAWFISVDSKENRFEGTRLLAEITEVFTPQSNWQPGEETSKIVSVTNTGETPALVRISLYEFLLTFQVDMTDRVGNGNLKESNTIVDPRVDVNDTDTWKLASNDGGTYTKDGKHYLASAAIVSDPKNGTDMYEYNSSTRPDTPLKFLSMNFSSAFKETAPSDGMRKYWLYENGYFYYSEVLQPGEESEPLINSVTLSSLLPNKYKSSLYKLKVFMDAHDTTSVLFSSWGVENNSDVYKMLENAIDVGAK
ncbi:BsaA family SipW-dependent biofilm matrix protein [Enterococcus wangshanyuanii]|uniref:Alternate signal-mediated exported protein, CPF_0494 family n=1 Tax=Enterococcus wangshanyuanii TaxID=2005703 RepID=A0ABQ1PTF9_9ENTE|nr:BsaA family SipW-dependent biofilm matrix protein [Enterococcus wangshanyuanii]GGD02997.1 hypothetical protein GCM10011573_35590 [Enterococcus wangshanyuanii]